MSVMRGLGQRFGQVSGEYRKTAAAAVLPDPNTEACNSARRDLVKALRAYQEVVTLDEFQHLGRSFMELYGFLLLADAEVAK